MKISNETKVGILAAVAIAIFIVGYNFLKGNDIFSSENEFYAKYDKVDGLAVSKPVLVNGYQVGRVSQLTLQPNGQILAQFKLDPKYAIPKKPTAIAPIKHKIIQVMLIFRAAGIDLTESTAINRARICG